MENYAFKSVAFGGFDKQDVIHYIEQTAKEAAAVQERLQKENEDLQTEADSLRTQVRELQTRLETETALREQAQSELEQERTARQGLEAFKPEAERLAAELERLRPEAEAYAQFRDRVGDIECDAHKRAAELEASTTARLRRTVELFRAQYVTLMSSFESMYKYILDNRLTEKYQKNAGLTSEAPMLNAPIRKERAFPEWLAGCRNNLQKRSGMHMPLLST